MDAKADRQRTQPGEHKPLNPASRLEKTLRLECNLMMEAFQPPGLCRSARLADEYILLTERTDWIQRAHAQVDAVVSLAKCKKVPVAKLQKAVDGVIAFRREWRRPSTPFDKSLALNECDKIRSQFKTALELAGEMAIRFEAPTALIQQPTTGSTTETANGDVDDLTPTVASDWQLFCIAAESLDPSGTTAPSPQKAHDWLEKNQPGFTRKVGAFKQSIKRAKHKLDLTYKGKANAVSRSVRAIDEVGTAAGKRQGYAPGHKPGDKDNEPEER